MTISMELMDWLKVFLILSSLIGNAVWIARTVKELKESYKALEKKISEMEGKLENKITQVEKELRYEIHEKVDKRQYYDDIGGWRTDIRELRKFVIELAKGDRK